MYNWLARSSCRFHFKRTSGQHDVHMHKVKGPMLDKTNMSTKIRCMRIRYFDAIISWL